MNFNLSSIAGFAIIGSLLAGWQQVKGFIVKIFSLLIRTDLIGCDSEGRILFENIIKKSKILRWGNRHWVIGGDCFIKKYEIYHHFLFLKEEYVFILYNKWIPLLLKKKDYGFNIIYLYKTIDLQKLLAEAYQESILFIKTARQQDSYFYFQEISGADARSMAQQETPSSSKGLNTGYGSGSSDDSKEKYFFPYIWLKNNSKYIDVNYSDLEQGSEEKKIKNYYWSKESTLLEREIEFWASNKNWFAERNIPHRRGALIYSVPGCGKSKMIYEVAMKTKTPLIKLNISNMSDEEFNRAYRAYGNTRTIILIEDIDAVFNGRTNILAENSNVKNLLSFDTLINKIGGAKQLNGIFTIITTNKIESLDAALIRAGRLDIKIEVGLLDKEGRKFIAENILKDWPELIDEFVEKHPAITVAEYENLCVEKALKLFYENKETAK